MADVTDSYNRADSSSSLGTADSGQTYTVLAGTWGIDTNKARNYTPSTQSFAVIDTGYANATVTLVVSGTLTSGGGVTFRASDANNLWFVEMDSGQTLLYKRVAGSFSSVITGMTTFAVGDQMKVVTTSNLIRVYKNGTLIGSTVDSFNNTATMHGLRDFGGAVRLDTLSVTETPVDLLALNATLASEQTFAATLSAEGYKVRVLQDTPAAYWRLDDAASSATYADSSGNSRTLTVSVDVARVAGGVDNGFGRNYAASTGWATLTGGGWYGSGSLTLECMFYLNSASPASQGHIAGFRSPATSGSFEMYIHQLVSTATLECRVGTVGGTEYTITTPAQSINVWHHAALVFDQSAQTLTMFIDRRQVGRVTGVNPTVGTTSTFSVGRTADGTNQYLGRVDDIAVYTSALTPTDLLFHWAQVPGGNRPYTVQSLKFESGSTGSTAAVTTSSIAFTVGDTLIAFVGTETGTTWTAPTGFTQVFRADQIGGNNDRLYCWTKVADGTEGTLTFTGSASHNRTLVLHQVAGLRAPDVARYALQLFGAPGTGGTIAGPSLVATADKTYGMAVFSANTGAGGTDSMPTGWTIDQKANSGFHDTDVAHFNSAIAANATVTPALTTGGTTWSAGIAALLLLYGIDALGIGTLSQETTLGGTLTLLRSMTATLEQETSLANDTFIIPLTAVSGELSSEMTLSATADYPQLFFATLISEQLLGSLTLNRGVMMAFTVDVSAEIGGTPMVPVEPVPENYAGDDDSDLETYPDPDYDEFGRPIS